MTIGGKFSRDEVWTNGQKKAARPLLATCTEADCDAKIAGWSLTGANRLPLKVQRALE